MGGKDAASPRYIFTKLEKITRTIFHPDDDELLTYLNDDGMSIEPEHYMPVIPMVLVNGSDGIGTGWSSTVSNYDPRVIVANIRHMISGEDLEVMHPSFYGFTGEILPQPGGKFTVSGKIERINATTLHISELPIKKWTQDYKTFLEGMLVGDKKDDSPPLIKDFTENHTDTTVSFTITAEESKIDEFEKEKNGGLYAKFKLIGSISTSNMNLFDTNQRIVKYDTPNHILQAFFTLRMQFYEKRKELLLEKLRKDQLMLSNKARFVEEVCSGVLIVSNRKRSALLADLQGRGYALFDKNDKKGTSDSEEGEEVDTASDADLARGYEYLLGMKIWSLTFEKAEELRAQLAEKTAELEVLEATSPSQIWLNDLDAIEDAMNERDQEIKAEHNDEVKAQKKNQKRNADIKKKAAAKNKGGAKKLNEWDSDIEDSDEDAMDSDVDEVVVPKKVVSRSRKPAAKKAIANAPPPPPAAAVAKLMAKPKEPEPPIEVDDVELSLAERMKKRMMISPPTKKSGVAGSAVFEVSIPTLDLSDSEVEPSRGTKRPSPKSSDSDDEDVIEVVETVVASSRGKKTLAKKPAAKTAPKRVRATAANKKTTSSTKVSANPKPKSKKAVPMDDSEEELDADSDIKEVPAAMTAITTGRRTTQRAQTKKTYTFDDSGTDSDSDFE
jgi:DNA topoisomerase II